MELETKKKKVLILGAKGMLGQELVRVFGSGGEYNATAWDIEDIDVTDFGVLAERVEGLGPDIILNAVAYNAVDQCEENETEFEKAMKLNAEVPQCLVRLSKNLDAIFVHYSTDYVFDGGNQAGYAEDALPHPLSRYGMSKWEGEKRVIAENGQYYLIRLSKLFGKPATSAMGKKSFFDKMLEVARDKDEVTIVDDEKSCFTYAPDLAQATKELVESGKPWGIYHLANEGPATWYEAARELFRLTGQSVAVRPVPASAFPRPARRPRFSALRNTKFHLLRSYAEALREFIGK